MPPDARTRILSALKAAPVRSAPPDPAPDLKADAGLESHRLVDTFCAKLAEQTGIVCRAGGPEEAAETLSEIFETHGLSRAVTSADPVITSLDLLQRGCAKGLALFSQSAYTEREAFRQAVFENADAGITGAEFGVAESGTLVLGFDGDHARLISLAPNLHIAFLPVSRIVADCEAALAGLEKEERTFSQIVFITGPSMTADIQGRPFKGMHGPQKLIVVLVG